MEQLLADPTSKVFNSQRINLSPAERKKLEKIWQKDTKTRADSDND